MDKTKIIIADDHQLFRNGIKSLIDKADDIEVVAEAEDGLDLMDKIKNIKGAIILMDLTMPKMGGIEAIQKLREERSDLKFIVLTMHDEGQYIIQSVKKGADGYLLKNAEEDELFKAIRTVASGSKYFNSNVSSLLIEDMSKPEPEFKALSPRELEVLKLVAEGEITKTIAEKLFVSTRTIETHRTNMMKKLKVHNTAELIKKAHELNFLS